MPVAHVRASHRVKSRSRKDALPATSITFIAIFALLVIFYSTSSTSSSLTSASLPSDSERATTPVQRTIAIPDLLERATNTGYGDLCSNEDSFLSKKPYLALFIPGVIFCFIGLAIVTDDYFVSALEQICEQLNLSEDVAGATFMAAGSSTPEFFASLLGVFVTRDEVGIGTIVGSAVFNILVIIGLSAALAGSVLHLDWRPLIRDSFFYVISVLLLLLFTLGPSKSGIEWWEGLVLVLTYLIYVLFMAYANKPYMAWAAKIFKRTDAQPDLEAGTSPPLPSKDDDFVPQPSLANNTSTATGRYSSMSTDGSRRYRDLNPRTRLKVAQYAIIAANRFALTSSSDNTDGETKITNQTASEAPAIQPKTFLGIVLPSGILGWLIFPLSFPWRIAFRLTILDCSEGQRQKWWPVTFILSICWISGISYIMVEAARVSGCLIGIPAPAMGLTVLAAGTSVPDALASISVARDGAGDMAVSNAIGSNVFDILLGLGFPWFLGALILKPAEGKDFAISIPTEPLRTVIVPILILLAIIVILVVILVLLRWQLSPKLGYTLFALYFGFVTYTLLDVFVWNRPS